MTLRNRRRPIGGERKRLERLQRLVDDAESCSIGWDRALSPTCERLDCTPAAADAYIRETVRRLHAGHFVSSVEQRGVTFDVYACYRGDLGWFVKLGEDDDGGLIISHHEPERGPLRTVGGETVRPRRPG